MHEQRLNCLTVMSSEYDILCQLDWGILFEEEQEKAHLVVSDIYLFYLLGCFWFVRLLLNNIV